MLTKLFINSMPNPAKEKMLVLSLSFIGITVVKIQDKGKKKRTVEIYLCDVFIHFIRCFLLFSCCVALLLFLSNCGCMTSEYTWYIKHWSTGKFLSFEAREWMFLKLFTIHKERRLSSFDERRRRSIWNRYTIFVIFFFLLFCFSFLNAASSLFMNQCFEFPSSCDAFGVCKQGTSILDTTQNTKCDKYMKNQRENEWIKPRKKWMFRQ